MVNDETLKTLGVSEKDIAKRVLEGRKSWKLKGDSDLPLRTAVNSTASSMNVSDKSFRVECLPSRQFRARQEKIDENKAGEIFNVRIKKLTLTTTTRHGQTLKAVHYQDQAGLRPRISVIHMMGLPENRQREKKIRKGIKRKSFRLS